MYLLSKHMDRLAPYMAQLMPYMDVLMRCGYQALVWLGSSHFCFRSHMAELEPHMPKLLDKMDDILPHMPKVRQTSFALTDIFSALQLAPYMDTLCKHAKKLLPHTDILLKRTCLASSLACLPPAV
jgi:hypothetical protein